MSLDHDDQNSPGFSESGNHADDASTSSPIANRKALTRDDMEAAVIRDYDDKIRSLKVASENRDYRDILTYRTICAAIILLDDEEDTAMVADMLRLARDSMTNADEILQIKGVSHE